MLTPRGFQLAEGLGHYLKSIYDKTFNLEVWGCKALDLKYSRTDNAERTKATAQAILKGMFPVCKIMLPFSPTGIPDPYFFPVQSKLCKRNNYRAHYAVKKRIGSYKKLLEHFHEKIILIQSITGCCAPTLCQIPSKSCTFMNLPGGLKQTGKISGPLQRTQEIVETFILEKAEGFTGRNWGWGKVNDDVLTFLSPLHTAYHDLVNRTPYLARIGGSNLAALIFNSIREATLKENLPPLVLIIGHDTNVDHVGVLFGLNWKPKNYVKNQVPPASGLVFELYYHPQTKTYSVRTYFITQTLEQMANLQLASEYPPEWILLQNPHCGSTDCNYDTWSRLIHQNLDKTCTSKDLKTAF